MSLRGWDNLECECGNKFFQQAVTLQWHEQHGTSIKQDGFTCTGCGKRSDTAKMIAVVKQKILQEKINELQGQVA